MENANTQMRIPPTSIVIKNLKKKDAGFNSRKQKPTPEI